MADKGIVTTQRPSIGRVARLAIDAGVSVKGWPIGNTTCNGAFAAVVCLRADDMLKKTPLPTNEWSIQEAYKAALEFLNAARTPL